MRGWTNSLTPGSALMIMCGPLSWQRRSPVHQPPAKIRLIHLYRHSAANASIHRGVHEACRHAQKRRYTGCGPEGAAPPYFPPAPVAGGGSGVVVTAAGAGTETDLTRGPFSDAP